MGSACCGTKDDNRCKLAKPSNISKNINNQQSSPKRINKINQKKHKQPKEYDTDDEKEPLQGNINCSQYKEQAQIEEPIKGQQDAKEHKEDINNDDTQYQHEQQQHGRNKEKEEKLRKISKADTMRLRELCIMDGHYYLNEIKDFVEENPGTNCTKVIQHILGEHYIFNTRPIQKFKRFIEELIHYHMPPLHPTHCEHFRDRSTCVDITSILATETKEFSFNILFDILFDIEVTECPTPKISDPQKVNELNKIRTKIQENMEHALVNKRTDDIKKETEDDEKKTESAQSQCCLILDESGNINKDNVSGSLKRIEIVLEAYHLLTKTIDKSLWNRIDIGDIIQINDMYQHQQLFDDFHHIRYKHIIPDDDLIRSHDHNEDDKSDKSKYNNIRWKLCQYFNEKYGCRYSDDIQECPAFLRHYRDRTNDKREQSLYFRKFQDEKTNINDVVFQQECDKIHCFFSHSTIPFGIESHQTTPEQEVEIDKINDSVPSLRFSKSYTSVFEADPSEQKKSKDETPKTTKKTSWYVGEKEDDLWWKDVSPDNKQQTNDQIYRILVENMGVFRWQNPHGFRTGQSQEIAHYQPRYANIKEEALRNKYEALSKDNWNQTLRKATIFFKSNVRQRIRTQYNGYFDDQVTGQKEKWGKGIQITMQEIVILKLYTDFDKLQFALKKCFRFETLDDILNEDEKEIAAQNKQYEKTKQELKNRLETFYHWRGGLLIVLNKFGTKLNHETNMVLYHGVNSKMLIKTSKTVAFNGPLSTSSSYYVARTFATAKGMVLKITSHFPRLNYCNAFDASLISDYPEEQEWLIGFMYVRLLQVKTRKLTDKFVSCQELLNTVPLSSWVREEFFAVHLFNEQIFSMNKHLERIIAQFLKVNRKECCDPKQKAKYKHQSVECNDEGFAKLLECVCTMEHGVEYGDDKDDTKRDMTTKEKEDMNRKRKIFPILWEKFNEFREHPNIKQRIKFDTISDHLKRFFMEGIKSKHEANSKRWIVSFKEITRVYPNVKEIHFVNHYKFDDAVLSRLITQIEGKDNKINKINKIVFLYYNYKVIDKKDDKNKPANSKIFKDPDELNDELTTKLQKLGWKIKHDRNGSVGYKIRIYDNKL